MPWYRTGTASVTNGSTTVTGSGTNWIDGAAVGEAFIGPDAKVYEIASIVSATQITLATAYQGTTQTGQSYQIVPSQSYIRDLAAQAATLVSNYGTAMTTAGQGAFGDGTVSAPGVRFTADGDTGLRRVGTNSVAVVAGGADRLTVDTAGVSVTGNLSVSGSLVGNAGTATKLQTARTLTVGNTGKNFDGSANVSWSLAEILGAGVPETAQVLGDRVDLNTIQTPGFYVQPFDGDAASRPNYPVPYAGALMVLRNAGVTQIYVVYGEFTRLFIRSYYSYTGSWSPWREIYHSGNLTGSLSPYGYQKLPGGLIIQWGTTLTVETDTFLDVIFPIAFPSMCASVVAQQTFGSGGGGVVVPGWSISSKTLTGFRINNDAVAQVFYWIALGY